MPGHAHCVRMIVAICLLAFPLYSSSQVKRLNIDSILHRIEDHLTSTLTHLKPTGLYPYSYSPDQESILMVHSSDWTSGFFPGMLWLMYEASGNSLWKKYAERWTSGLEQEKYNRSTHDLGFMLFCSFGNGQRIHPRPHYENVLLTSAKSLASRYNSKVGCIKSWDNTTWKFPVIIDTMMNLELLFWAFTTTKDSAYYTIAVNHASTTLKNHYRNDGSAYHLLDYNPTTGEVIARAASQGYSVESAWARGQAWGLYGFTMVYRETGDEAYLKHAEKIASYFIRNLPKNYIPYWDFKAPFIPFEFQDTSAAAIAASALFELSTYSPANRDYYFNTASEMLSTLCSPAFFADTKTNGNFLLKHGVGHMTEKKQVNAPLIFSDYYLLEALLRYHLIINK